MMNLRKLSSLLLLFVLMAFVAGCKEEPISFSDDLDLKICFYCGKSDRLNSPYVVGTEMSLYAHREDKTLNLKGSVLASSDDDVLEVYHSSGSLDRNWAFGRAHSAGVVNLVLFEDAEMDDVISSIEVVVAQPDDAHFVFAGPIVIDRESLQKEVEGSVQIVAGGTAAFLVEYTKNGERLHGNGVLVPHASSESVLTEVDQTYFFENNDWLIVTPMLEGTYTVDIEVGGEIIDTLTIEAVSEDVIDAVAVFNEKEPKGDADGGGVYVWAVGQSADGEWIYGVDFEWALNSNLNDLCDKSPAYYEAVVAAIEEAIVVAEAQGITWEEAYVDLKPNEDDYMYESCTGDLFSYTYSKDAGESNLEALYGDKSAHTTIHANPDGHFNILDTENAIGCSATNDAGAPGRAALWVFSILMGSWILRRRHLPTAR